MAAAFMVSERTVFRWERSGITPSTQLQLDAAAHPNSGPNWRRKLLKFLLDRYRERRVSLTTKNTGRRTDDPG